MESLILAQDERWAGGLTHASRTVTGLRMLTSGERVRNAYATCPLLENSPEI